MRRPPVFRGLLGRAAPVVPALLAISYLFWPVLAKGLVFGSHDHGLFYWPVKSAVAALARSSHGIPLWNPLLAAGQPFAANPEHAVFHPLTSLFLFLPFEWAFRLQVVLPVFFLALAGYFLGRTLLLPRPAAAFSAAAWGVGGATVSLLQLLPTLFTLAPLPVALGFAVRIGRRRVPMDLLGFAASYGFMVLGGEPPGLLMGALLSAVAVGHGSRLAGPEEREARPFSRRIGRLVLGGLLGAAIGGATLVPGFFHALRTVRAEGLDAATALSFTTPAARLAEVALPGALGADSAHAGSAPLGERLYPGRGGPFLASIYPGVLLLAAAVTGWAPRKSPARPWAFTAALGTVLALGAATPVFPAMRALPGLSGIRFPERFLFLTLVSLTVAGVCGVSRLLSGDSRELRRAAAGGVLALAFAAALAVSAGASAGALVLLVARQVAILGVGFGAIVLASRSAHGSALRLLPAALLAADLAAAGRPLLGSRPPSELRALPPALRPLRSSPPRGYVFHAAAQDRSRHRVADMASPPFLAQFGIASALDRDFDLTELAWSSHATASVLQAIANLPGQADAILARRGIAAVVAFRRGAPFPGFGAPGESPEDGLALLAVPRPQPLAFAASRLVVARGGDGWRAAVASAGPAARELAVVDPADVPWAAPADVSPARVGVVSRGASRLELSIEALGPGPSFVALNQTWDPGWKGVRNGKPIAVVRTDLSLSGFLVPPGRHEVVLTYRSVPVLAGLATSLVALFATGLAARSGRRRES